MMKTIRNSFLILALLGLFLVSFSSVLEAASDLSGTWMGRDGSTIVFDQNQFRYFEQGAVIDGGTYLLQDNVLIIKSAANGAVTQFGLEVNANALTLQTPQGGSLIYEKALTPPIANPNMASPQAALNVLSGIWYGFPYNDEPTAININAATGQFEIYQNEQMADRGSFTVQGQFLIAKSAVTGNQLSYQFALNEGVFTIRDQMGNVSRYKRTKEFFNTTGNNPYGGYGIYGNNDWMRETGHELRDNTPY